MLSLAGPTRPFYALAEYAYCLYLFQNASVYLLMN